MSVVVDMDEATYHARPELSSTEARLLLESPAKYRWKKDNPPLIAPSKKFDLGTAVHSRVLGTGYDVVVIPQEILATNGAVSTKAAKEFVADVRAEGKVPIKQEDFDLLDGSAASILAHPGARQLFAQPATAEVSVFATDPHTQIPVRARFDFLPTQAGDGAPSRVAVDLKTAADASPDGFTKSIANYNYDVQRAWYLDALLWETGETAELVFVVVEKEPPYLVGVYQLPTIWVEMGLTKARRARELFKQCSETDHWPGYSDSVELLTPPNWLIYKHEEQYA